MNRGDLIESFVVWAQQGSAGLERHARMAPDRLVYARCAKACGVEFHMRVPRACSQ